MAYVATEAATGTNFAAITLPSGVKLPQSSPASADGVAISPSNRMPVAVADLPLPAGATTALAQAAANASLASMDTKTPALVNSRVPVAVAGNGVTYTDRSGAIATGGGAQALAPANPSRVGLMFQNTSSGDLRVSSRGSASGSAGILVKTGDLFIWPAHGVPVGIISVFGATTAQAFEAMEW